MFNDFFQSFKFISVPFVYIGQTGHGVSLGTHTGGCGGVGYQFEGGKNE